MRRLLAVALAVAMVAAALFIRDRLDDADDEGGESGGRGNGEGGAPLVVCVPELEAACRAIEADGAETRVEAAGTTFDALVAGEADLDGWLTLAPWPAMAEGARQRLGRPPALEEDLPPALGRTRIVLVGRSERMGVLNDECGGEAGWGCLGEVAGLPWQPLGGEATWGTVKPGYDDPRTSASGLVVLGAAVADFLGTTQIARADLETEEVRTWLVRLRQARPRPVRGRTLIEHFVVQHSAYDAVGALEAEAAPLVGSARGEGLTILYPSGMATADAVLVWAPGAATDEYDDDVHAVLQAAGWRIDDPGLPENNGLPSAGALEALREIAG